MFLVIMTNPVLTIRSCLILLLNYVFMYPNRLLIIVLAHYGTCYCWLEGDPSSVINGSVKWACSGNDGWENDDWVLGNGWSGKDG